MDPRRPVDRITDDDIRRVLSERAAMEDYPLSAEDVARSAGLLIDLIREKMQTLAGPRDDTPMTIVEGLNHALMSRRWLTRNLTS